MENKNNNDMAAIKWLLHGILACCIIVGLAFVPMFSIGFWGLIALSIIVVFGNLIVATNPTNTNEPPEPFIVQNSLLETLTPEERKRQDRISYIVFGVFLGLIFLIVVFALCLPPLH